MCRILLPLPVSYTHLPFVIDALKKRLEHEVLGYTFACKEWAESIINWLKERHGTLARVYAEASKRWRWYHEDEDFDAVFIQLFRGRDQQVARLWLDLVRTKAGQHPACLKAGETTLNIHLKKTQVERAENILSKLGLSMSEAVSLFLAQVLWDGLPFGVALPDPDDREDMAPIEGQLSLDNEPEIPWDEDVSAEV